MDTPTTTTTCETCPKCLRKLEIGSWPWCPHGKPTQVVIPDDYGQDIFCENMSHEGVWYRTRSERRRLMKEHQVEEFIRHQPLRGSDKSPHTVSWDRGSIDRQTIQNAADLVDPARRQRGAGDAKPGFRPYPVTVRELPSE